MREFSFETRIGEDKMVNECDYIPLEQYFDAYYDCRRHKRNTMNALAFELNYEDNLVKLHDEVQRGEYKIGKSIAFIVTKPKCREVFAADFRDRVIHHLVMRKIEPLFEAYFIEDNYNCRKGKGTLYGIKRLHERLLAEGQKNPDTYIGKFDIQGFFMSIHKPTLWAMVSEFLEQRYMEDDKPLVMQLTKQIILHCPEENCIRKSPAYMWDYIGEGKSLFSNGKDYGLPIGNLSSQMFANFYLHSLDVMLDAKFIYGRYVDDFYVVGRKKEILNAIPEMRSTLKSINCRLHPKKVYVQHWTKGVKFIGGVTKKDRLYVSNRTVDNYRMMVREIEGCDKEGSCDKVAQRVNSYLGYFSHFKTYNIRRGIERDFRGWIRYFYFSDHISKVVLRYRYNPFKVIKKEIKEQRYAS